MDVVKHTPGPWHRNIPPARKYPTVWAGRNTHVAAVVAGAPRGSGDGGTMSDDELEANINLIAAAPDMLAALKRLMPNNLGSFPATMPASPVLPGWRAAPEVALPPRCDIEVSALREGFRRASQ